MFFMGISVYINYVYGHFQVRKLLASQRVKSLRFEVLDSKSHPMVIWLDELGSIGFHWTMQWNIHVPNIAFTFTYLYYILV